MRRLWHIRFMRAPVAIRALLIAIALLALATSGSRAQTDVDLQLVLAVDVSWSMDPEEQRLQRDGYVEAFRDALVQKAIQSGPNARIAATYFEWAGPDIHFVVIPWTLLDGRPAIEAFAARLAERQISRHRMTSISSALQFAVRQLDASPFRSARRVVDVSGDGPNNAGPSPVTRIRDELVRAGIVINGLPIMLKTGVLDSYGWGQDIADLDVYYSNCVIGGPGSFVIPIRKREEFATATRQKLLLEISGLLPPRLRHAQLGPPPAAEGEYDCEIGERNWRRNYMDRGRF